MKNFLINAVVGLIGLSVFGVMGFLWTNYARAATAISLSGSDTMTIDSDRTITGDIELTDNAVLTIQNATVRMTHTADDPRTDILLSGNAKLIITNAALVPAVMNPDNLYLTASGTSSIEMTSATFINVLNLVENAKITGTKAKIYSSTAPFNIPETEGAFGIVQLAGNAVADFTDSTIGSFALFFSETDDVSLANLKPQLYADFNLARDAVKFSPQYNIILKNTRVLPVKVKGPFERSWAIFVDPKTKISISDSSLNKLVFQQFNNETVGFSNLGIDKPQQFDFRGIHLLNTTIANEWGFFGENSNITVSDSKGVWLWPIGKGTWRFKKSQMIEFDPRGFLGTLIFEGSEWANAGEIFEKTNITLKGVVKMTQSLDRHLVLSDSKITREYPIKVRDRQGKEVKNFTADLYAGTKKIAAAKTANGTAYIRAVFTSANYKKLLVLKATANGKATKQNIFLFSNTPISVYAR